MKPARLITPTLLGLALALVFVLSVAGADLAQSANTRYVSPAGTDSGACTNSAAPCRTVQYAVDAAQAGDEIRVAAGTYTGVLVRSAPAGYPGPGVVTQTLYLTKTVTVRGGYNANFSVQNPDVYTTTLDAQGLGRVLFIAGSITPTISDLRLVNGSAGGLKGHPLIYDAGGGLYVMTATATLSNLDVVSNTAPGQGWGGGMFLLRSPSTLSQSLIQGNVSGLSGGGIELYESDALIAGNLILQNDSDDDGGGLRAYRSSFTLSGNVIQQNTSFGSGAGISIHNSDDPFQPVLTRNTIVSNTATYGFSTGGGIYLRFSDPVMSGNRIQGNTSGYGGGVYFYRGEATSSTNDVFLYNQATQAGPGVYLNGCQAVFQHPTLAGNSGGDGSALHLVENTDFGSPISSTAAITNAIIVMHTVGITASVGNTATVNGVLWFNNTGGNTAGAGSIIVSNAVAGDPAFSADGYHLTGSSMGVDQGVNSGVPDDIDGTPRPVGLGYDLGADERLPFNLFLPLIRR